MSLGVCFTTICQGFVHNFNYLGFFYRSNRFLSAKYARNTLYNALIAAITMAMKVLYQVNYASITLGSALLLVKRCDFKIEWAFIR